MKKFKTFYRILYKQGLELVGALGLTKSLKTTECCLRLCVFRYRRVGAALYGGEIEKGASSPPGYSSMLESVATGKGKEEKEQADSDPNRNGVSYGWHDVSKFRDASSVRMSFTCYIVFMY